MGFEISGAVQDAVMNAVKAGLDSGYIKIYKGTIPADPGDAIVDEASNLLVTISESGGATGLTFEAAASGVISKATAETWVGEVAQTGTATFYRFSPTTDTGGADDTIMRVQGTVGTLSADLLLASVDLVITDDQRIDYYSLGIPGE